MKRDWRHNCQRLTVQSLKIKCYMMFRSNRFSHVTGLSLCYFPLCGRVDGQETASAAELATSHGRFFIAT
jgi:hypothetical protein